MVFAARPFMNLAMISVAASTVALLALPAFAQTASIATPSESERSSAETQAPPEPGASHWHVPPCANPDEDGDVRMSTGCSGVFGLRGSVVDVRGAEARTGVGLMVSAEGEEFVRRAIFSAHGSHRLAIGGGGAGFEGTLAGALAGGFRIPVAERHGPVLRAGILGYLRGNDAFYASLLELPQLQLGYQYMRGITVFELGATTGVVLTGRERIGDTERRALGNGFEIGAYGAMQMRWIRLGARATRLPTKDAIVRDVDVAEGTLCGMAAPIAICIDARGARTDVFDASGAPKAAQSIYAGLSMGFTRER